MKITHYHAWRNIESHVKSPLKQEVCDCGMRRFTKPDGKVFYLAGYQRIER